MSSLLKSVSLQVDRLEPFCSVKATKRLSLQVTKSLKGIIETEPLKGENLTLFEGIKLNWGWQNFFMLFRSFLRRRKIMNRKIKLCVVCCGVVQSTIRVRN